MSHCIRDTTPPMVLITVLKKTNNPTTHFWPEVGHIQLTLKQHYVGSLPQNDSYCRRVRRTAAAVWPAGLMEDCESSGLDTCVHMRGWDSDMSDSDYKLYHPTPVQPHAKVLCHSPSSVLFTS